MLPDIHLDQVTFEEMLERAKNKIAGCYPEWTDFNYHDPGITLVELFAWLKEIQQYELNHIGEAHRESCLHLLGTGTEHRQSAETFVCVQTERELHVPAGTRFAASGVVFETGERRVLPGVEITRCFGLSEAREQTGCLDRDQMTMENPPGFYPFGRKAEQGSCFYIQCSGPLPTGEELCLTVRVFGDGKKARNPARRDTVLLAAFGFSCWNGRGYRPVRVLVDETFGLLFDGQIRFLLEEQMEPCEVGGESGYFLRVKLEESQYEMPPALSFLDLNTLKVRQKETMAVWLAAQRGAGEAVFVAEHDLCARGKLRVFAAEGEERYREIEAGIISGQETEYGRAYIHPREELPFDAALWVLAGARNDWFDRHQTLGTAHGFPGERFSLDEALVCREDLEILVRDRDRPNCFRRWEKQESFAYSGPEDCHYCVDGARGQILFGDGFHGMAPEGEIVLAAYARVQGSEGNIKAHRLRPDADGAWERLWADNPWKSSGGRDEESLDEAFDRVRRKLEHTGSMVTSRDYEKEVCQTPGLRIESCKAMFGADESDGGVRGKQTVQIVVKPCSLEKQPRLTRAFVQNIQNFLEQKRLLGVQIQIVSPVYIRLSVHLEIAVHPQYLDAEETTVRAVRDYLRPVTTGFGRTASYSGLYGQIDRLPCVFEVRSLAMEARGNGVRRNSYGDVCFPGSGIADEIEVQCSCSFARY